MLVRVEDMERAVMEQIKMLSEMRAIVCKGPARATTHPILKKKPMLIRVKKVGRKTAEKVL